MLSFAESPGFICYEQSHVRIGCGRITKFFPFVFSHFIPRNKKSHLNYLKEYKLSGLNSNVLEGVSSQLLCEYNTGERARERKRFEKHNTIQWSTVNGKKKKSWQRPRGTLRLTENRNGGRPDCISFTSLNIVDRGQGAAEKDGEFEAMKA